MSDAIVRLNNALNYSPDDSILVSRKCLVEAKAEIERLRAALQAVRDWHWRDGSVGGCDLMMHEHVVPFTKEPGSE